MTAQQRLELIKEVIEKNRSVYEVSKEAGISRKTFYKWLNRYKSSTENNKLVSLENRQWNIIRNPKRTPLILENKTPPFHPEEKPAYYKRKS